MKKVAVITDAVSPKFWFPTWHAYYGSLFGTKNLHVLTFSGLSRRFDGIEVGSLREIEHDYDDYIRCRTINEAVADLLTSHDAVVRVDVDEILIADPARYTDLASYVQALSFPYATARGFNVLQAPGDPPLDPSRPILYGQRRWLQALGPMNKTAIVQEPLEWSPGFHFCNRQPRFDDLYLIHLKHAAMARATTFSDYMCNRAEGNADVVEYFDVKREILTARRDQIFDQPRVSGPDAMLRHEFNARYLASIVWDDHSFYCCPHIEEDAIVEIPEAFAGLI
jgi:hypothetical protein